jgi:hypothetical protein
VADQRQQVERVLDLALYAPVGLVLTLRDQLPQRLRQRRQAVENRVQLARFVGELAVRYGRNEIERELRQHRDGTNESPAGPTEQGAPDVAPSSTAVAPVTAESATAVQPPDVGATDVSAAETAAAADALPIGDYESLAAIHVVQRLASLRADEVEQIRRFEAAHRARRTVLAKIAQLQEATDS